jgi:hypothetical protein
MIRFLVLERLRNVILPAITIKSEIKVKVLSFGSTLSAGTSYSVHFGLSRSITYETESKEELFHARTSKENFIMNFEILKHLQEVIINNNKRN